MSIIYGLNDITLVPTPVTYVEGGSNKTWIEHQQKALLYSARVDGDRGRLATIWLSNVYGFVFREVGRLQSLEVREADRGCRHATTHQIRIAIVPPRQRRAKWYDRNFPTHCVLIAWGLWDVCAGPDSLSPSVASTLWHDDQAFRRHWEDVRDTVNCAAESAVFLDTVTTVLDARPDAEAAAAADPGGTWRT